MITLAPLQVEQLDELMRYEPEMFGAEAWSIDGYRFELADTRTRNYVAAVDDAGALLGWAGIRVIGDEAEVLTVGVIPAARRQGIGGQLMAELYRQAEKGGARAIYLEVRVDNDPARRLYEQDGFAQVGVRRGYYDSGRVDAVVMRRDL